LLALGVIACGGSSDGGSSGGSGEGGTIDLVAYSTPETAYVENLIPGFEETEAGAGVAIRFQRAPPEVNGLGVITSISPVTRSSQE